MSLQRATYRTSREDWNGWTVPRYRFRHRMGDPRDGLLAVIGSESVAQVAMVRDSGVAVALSAMACIRSTIARTDSLICICILHGGGTRSGPGRRSEHRHRNTSQHLIVQ